MSNVSPFRYPAIPRRTQAEKDSAAHDALVAEVRAEVMADLRNFIASLAHTPEVTVAPHISVPDALPPDVEVNVDLSALPPAIRGLTEQLALANRPVVRTIERDRDGMIVSITETRP